MAGVDPAVEAPGEGVGHAVGVAEAVRRRRATSRLVGLAVAVGVGEAVDVGDASRPAPRRRRRAGRTPIGMFRPSANVVTLPGPAVGAEVVEDLDACRAASAPRLAGYGILDGVGDPEPAPVVEGEVHRLVDVGLGGDELDLEAGREVESPALSSAGVLASVGATSSGGSGGGSSRDWAGSGGRHKKNRPQSISRKRRIGPPRTWGESQVGRAGKQSSAYGLERRGLAQGGGRFTQRRKRPAEGAEKTGSLSNT